MANLLPAVTRVSPSYVAPEIITQINQASGAFDLLGGGDMQVRLGDGDQYVYMKALTVRTKVAAGQSAYNNLPSCSIEGFEISTPTYLVRNRAEYDHHDVAAGSQWGISVPKAQSLAMRQGHFQQARSALLYGFNPQNGEGILNTPGATAVNLPPDTNGNTTIATYDNGQLAFVFLQQILNIKTRMYQLGMPSRVVVLGPQRVLGQMEMVNIVQLVQFQRVGAGTATTKGLIQDILSENKDSLIWVYDDTLIGKGAGGTDAILIVVPEIDVPTADGVNTNEFAKLTPSQDATITMLCDMAAPREIPTPIAGGAIDVVSEWRFTSGWAIRSESVTILSAQYS